MPKTGKILATRYCQLNQISNKSVPKDKVGEYTFEKNERKLKCRKNSSIIRSILGSKEQAFLKIEFKCIERLHHDRDLRSG